MVGFLAPIPKNAFDICLFALFLRRTLGLLEALLYRAKSVHVQRIAATPTLHTTLVAMDAESRAELGISPSRSTELPKVYPSFVDACAEAGATVVYMDVWFGERTQNIVGMAESYRRAGNVVTGSVGVPEWTGNELLEDAPVRRLVADIRGQGKRTVFVCF